MADRDWASRGDYRPYGGTNTNSFTCEPATIRVTGVSSGTAPGGGQIFLSPGDTTPVANNAALNGNCNLSIYNSFIPSQYRTNGMIKVVNDFSDNLSLSASLLYNRNQTHQDSVPASSTTPRCSAPAPASRASRIRSSPRLPARRTRRRDHQLAGDARRRQVRLHRVPAGRGLRQRRPRLQVQRQLVADLRGLIGWNRSSLDGFKQFCGACATLALNGTTQSGGSTTASSVAGQNVVVLQLPLTTTNALDVWNAPGANRTNPLVMDSLYTSNTQNNNYNTFNQFRAVVQGDLFDMPAGPVRSPSAANTCGRSSSSS